ncbi:MAG: glycoside hydrolase family 9 protein [Pseudomonadota bacterium]
MNPPDCTTFVAVTLILAGCAGHAEGEHSIRINQIGFLPGSAKQAVVASPNGDSFGLIDTKTNAIVFEAALKPLSVWPPSGEAVRIADFSALTRPGQYRLVLDEKTPPVPVAIHAGVYAELARASLKAFYYNRSGIALEKTHAGRWSRAAGHADTRVLVHESASSASRPPGHVVAAPHGWYDAGDFNKYVVNSGISTYTLLAAYEHFPDFFDALDLNIPESGNALPDILDEVHWNLRWMLAMQDPADGGVYHKLTSLEFAGAVMPQDARAERYVVQKTTAAALNFAAVMAVAQRVYSGYDALLPGFAERCRAAAVAAYDWALRNPDVVYEQPADVLTGEYGDLELGDEFFWASVELFLGSSDLAYLEVASDQVRPLTTPGWQDVAGLAYVSLLNRPDRLPGGWRARSRNELERYANELVEHRNRSAYGIAYGTDPGDFHWGGTSTALNQAILLLRAFALTNDRRYFDAATANVDYVLGRNAVGLSFVTGFGQRSPMRIHHRVSESDGIAEPVPGFLVGGPTTNGQDGCRYPSSLPARSYLDAWCSYTTNEIAINWNAPLVYVTAALQTLVPGSDSAGYR